MSLTERLDKIRSPKLQNQRETAVVLSAVEDTLKDQGHDFTPTAYYAALLALLAQIIDSSKGVVNKDLATSVVYLLDIITPHVPAPLLRSKFSQILTNLAPVLTSVESDAPLLRPSIGCLESLLLAQDAEAWALPQAQIGPRGAVAGLLALAVDHRPKVRKRAQDALTEVLQTPPPSPSLDHPAADLCAHTALHSLKDVAKATNKKQRGKGHGEEDHQPGLMHAIQLVKVIASASGGWPSKTMDSLCEVLLSISKSSNEYLTIAAFEVFEAIFTGMANEVSAVKLPRLMEAISELQPSQKDSQLLPPWIAIISRGYDVSSQISPDETFQKLPDPFEMVSGFLASMSPNIRISASECLVSFLANCVPETAILNPSIYDEKVLEKLCKIATNLLSVKYQAAWMEVFSVLSALFETLKSRSASLLQDAVKAVGELRGSDSFNGKKDADTVLGNAIEAMGPALVLEILPLNLAIPRSGQPGRAWLLPLLRDHVISTNLMHFRTEFVPLSEALFQKVIDHGNAEKTMEIKIFETLVQQIWALLPGYCSLPLDLTSAFDQSFAELIANLLYKQADLRADLCKALQMLVDTNKQIQELETGEQNILLRRVSKDDAKKNIDHLSSYASNLLAVLFNVYSQTLPQFRGFILQCINAYLSITPENELIDTFTRVTTTFEAALAEANTQTQGDKQKQKQSTDKMPPTTHTLMDLVITISIYLPRSSFPTLFALAAVILPRSSDPQLQKKAYKLLPRLATSSAGVVALQERSLELQQLLLNTASSASAPARRDRLAAIAVVVSNIPSSSLHFIPSVLSEVVISAKEVNEKARTEAFDLLVLMGKKMAEGGTIAQSQIPHMAPDAQDVDASLAEYFTMVSAGLAGSTPHMISASIIALTRILYEFHAELSDALLLDLISTMDLFLSSNNREIVRSVLGFVKVAIIGLPENIIRPRLPTLIPGLMGWSHEHKTRFRAKVKHIIERLIRRFGYDTVERNCPEADKKLIANIRKTKERNKRKKAGGGDSDDNETAAMTPKRAARKFESEFDRAVYGSGSDGQDVDSENNPESDSDDDAPNGHRGKGRRSKTYIVEDEDEPLDLLGRKALGHISSTKPLRLGKGDGMRARPKAKTDRNGKLIFGGDADGDVAGEVMVLDEPGDGSLEDGINAYVAAIKGRNAVQRGRGGRLKFSNRKGGEEMDVDDEGEAGAKPGKKAAGGERGGKGKEGGGRGGIGRGGAGRRFSGAKGERGGKNQRRGLGVQGSGRVVKRGGRDGGRGRR